MQTPLLKPRVPLLHFSLAQEPCLNPALEEQAIGRSWRMGQKRNVVVKRFYIKVRTAVYSAQDFRAGVMHAQWQRVTLSLLLSLALFPSTSSQLQS